MRIHTGESNPNSKLDSDQVKMIRDARGEQSAKALAQFYDVSVATIYKIWSKERWKP